MQHTHPCAGIRLTVAAMALAALVTLGPQAAAIAGAAAPPAYPQAQPSAGGPGSGDVPDNAVYLRYKGKGFSIEYIEGWLQTSTKRGMTFQDKDSAVVVELYAPWHSSLATYVRQVDLPRLMRSPGFVRGALARDTIARIATMRLSYRGRSAPDPVTGKVVTLQSDRYYVSGPHTLALITLSTPLGVDNVDAFHRIAHSFNFR